MTLEISDLKFRPFLQECAPFPDSPAPGKEPKELVIFEIDFDIDIKGNLEIKFSKAWGPVRVNATTTLNDHVSNILKGVMPKNNKIINPLKSGPLSLKADKNRYVFYKLSDKNWQFSQGGYPFQIQKNDVPAGIYYEARRITPNGDVQERGAGGTNGDLSRLAYFICNGKDMLDNIEGTLEYHHGLNIYIDFYDSFSDTAMPVVIDPDIRYPGGKTLDDDSPNP